MEANDDKADEDGERERSLIYHEYNNKLVLLIKKRKMDFVNMINMNGRWQKRAIIVMIIDESKKVRMMIKPLGVSEIEYRQIWMWHKKQNKMKTLITIVNTKHFSNFFFHQSSRF